MSSPRIARATVTPILIADPPLLNVLGVHQPWAPRMVVELETDDGVTGVGETYGDSDYLAIAETLAEHVVGEPLTALNRLPALAGGAPAAEAIEHDPSGLRGARTTGKLVKSVVSAFEVASLDALGRHTGLPVHALLGGKVRDRVEFSGYLFYRWAGHDADDAPSDDWGEAVDPAGVVAQAERMARDHGFRSFKLKGGVFPPAEEVAAMHALRDAFPDAPLRLDPNGGWSVEASLEVARELAGVVEYLEDPTPGVEGMARVHSESGVPLATNMLVTATEEIAPAFAAGAVQVVLSDHHYWGGLLATRDLDAICRAHGVALSMHSNTHLGISLAAMTHAAAVVDGLEHSCDTHRPWQVEDVIRDPHVFRDGELEVPDGPGLGVELDRDALASLHERWLERADVRDRDDVAAMQRVVPDWKQPALPRW